MTQLPPSNHELVLRKLANEHEVAMYKAQTDRYQAVTRRIWAIGWLVLFLCAPLLGYAAGAGAITRDWLTARLGNFVIEATLDPHHAKGTVSTEVTDRRD